MLNQTFELLLNSTLMKSFTPSANTKQIYIRTDYKTGIKYQITITNKYVNGDYIWHLSAVYGKLQMYQGPGLDINLSLVPNDKNILQYVIQDYCERVISCKLKVDKMDDINKRKKDLLKDFMPDS